MVTVPLSPSASEPVGMTTRAPSASVKTIASPLVTVRLPRLISSPSASEPRSAIATVRPVSALVEVSGLVANVGAVFTS
ncbi:hypothetical protein H2O14_05865 [Rhizobium sp. G21]|nr:hypothetical protein [Rhizobium sp. G21]MBB1248344.1 hypothetical protein [Rhizobium sp. G21]